MREEVRKARKAFDRSRPKPAACCQRCGMTQEEHIALGRSSLQIHHIRPIRELGMAANNPSNYHTLCKPCHDEWHKFWELAGKEYEDFFEAEPFFQKLQNEQP
jgi:5-methylcytosine-specific restriction endonuclease McrA